MTGITELAADVALRLAGAAEGDIDGVVIDALAALAMSAGAERAYVTMYHGDGTFDNSHEWTEPWIVPHAPAIKALSSRQFPYSHGMAERGEVLDVRELSDLPPEGEAERQSFGSFGVRSILQVPIRVDGELLGLIGFNHYHETSRWDAETIDRLRQVAQAVGVALARRAADRKVRLALAVAERANVVHDELIAAASHELRTPLHAVLGFAELLAVDGVRHPALEQIQHNGKALLVMIDDLLELGRLASPGDGGDTAPTTVEDLIGEVGANLRPVASQHGATLTVEPVGGAPVMATDPLRLRQALHCLASSALAAAGAGGEVRVHALADAAGGWGTTRIALIASGPRHQPVGGLGLALARSFVEAFDGDLVVEEAVDRTRIVVSAGRTRGRTPHHGGS